MVRWEPGTRERLERAALELFARDGYEQVAVRDIAAAAGVTRATFFRVFPDKREVLFWGQDLLADLLAEGVASAPDGSSTADLVAAALRSVATAFPPDRHELAATREALTAQHSELRERLAAKRAALRDALRTALVARNVPDVQATVAAEIGRAAFSAAYGDWAAARHPSAFTGFAERRLADLLAAAGRLTAAGRLAAASD